MWWVYGVCSTEHILTEHVQIRSTTVVLYALRSVGMCTEYDGQGRYELNKSMGWEGACQYKIRKERATSVSICFYGVLTPPPPLVSINRTLSLAFLTSIVSHR